MATKWHWALNRLLPIEHAALVASVSAVVLVMAFDLTLYFPDSHSSTFALEHYLLGVLLSAFIATGLHSLSNRQLMGIVVVTSCREMIALSLIVFLHFNFKLWSCLVNPVTYDALYADVDQRLSTLVMTIEFINLGFNWLKAIIPDAYHDLFVVMFLVTFIVFSATKRRDAFSDCLLTVGLVLLLGGLAYIPFPAFGQFYYLPDTGSHANLIQQNMLTFSQRFMASNGETFSGDEFIMPLAAMPSLHIAHAFVLLHFARKHMRWLGYVYLPIFIFLASEAVASRWHYLIDLPVGLAISLMCIKVTHMYRQCTHSHENSANLRPA